MYYLLCACLVSTSHPIYSWHSYKIFQLRTKMYLIVFLVFLSLKHHQFQMCALWARVNFLYLVDASWKVQECHLSHKASKKEKFNPRMQLSHKSYLEKPFVFYQKKNLLKEWITYARLCNHHFANSLMETW